MAKFCQIQCKWKCFVELQESYLIRAHQEGPPLYSSAFPLSSSLHLRNGNESLRSRSGPCGGLDEESHVQGCQSRKTGVPSLMALLTALSPASGLTYTRELHGHCKAAVNNLHTYKLETNESGTSVAKSQLIKLLGAGDHIISVANSPLCCWIVEAAIDHT